MPVDGATLAKEKFISRKAAGKNRAAAHEQNADRAAQDIAETGLDFLKIPGGLTVSGFYPCRTEIDLRPLLVRLASEGWRTCLPIVLEAGLPLVFKAWVPGDETEPGIWDIPIPVSSAETVEPDVMLVPLLAFDRQGYRLGYGGGFYDRTIEKLRRQKPLTTVGIAFAAQEMTMIAHDCHDQRLDWILTEEGPIKIQG